jgi:hypothetical protein
VGLLLQSSSLTNGQSHEFRRAFFEQQHVHRITNFSNLVYKLFNADEPAMSLVFSAPERSELVANTQGAMNEALFTPAERSPIIHFGPLAANQVIFSPKGNAKSAWLLTVYQDEIQTVDAEEAMKGDALTWKVALWGSYRDARALMRLQRRFDCTLERVLNPCKRMRRKAAQTREMQPSTKPIRGQMPGSISLCCSRLCSFWPQSLHA